MDLLRRRVVAAFAVALAMVTVSLMPAAAGAAPSGPSGEPPSGAPSSQQPARLAVAVRVNRFVAKGRRTTAQATATATLTNFSGQATTIKQQVTLSAATGTSCRVLNLFLERLDLNLLGLGAHLDKVNLTITGHSDGGVLGVLFCRLSHALATPGAKKARLAALNSRLRHKGLSPLTFTVRVDPKATASQAPGSQCQILDLVLGPLNLNLLGLEVALNQVHLNVVATRGGGVLGDLFCSLADGKR